MVNANGTLNNCFSVRFQSVKEVRNPHTADMVISNEDKKEFFELVERFGLIAIYAENDVWYIKPNPSTRLQDLIQHTSTWDIMFHKYFAKNNTFKRENEEYFRKKKASVIPIPVQIVVDTSVSMS